MSDGNEPWAIALIAVVRRYDREHGDGWRPSATDMATDVRAELAVIGASRIMCQACGGSGILFTTDPIFPGSQTVFTSWVECGNCSGCGWFKRLENGQMVVVPKYTEEEIDAARAWARRTAGAD